MSLLANRRVRIAQEVITYVRRELTEKGKITAQVGQEVFPDDILGSATVSAGFRTVKVAKLLSVGPREARKYLQRPIGQAIYKGELLAFKPGGILGGKKVVVSPSDGLLDSFDEKTGELRLNFLPHQKDLPAAVFGIVEKVDQDKGQVTIKTQTTQIFGVLGTGRVREGILKVLGERGDLVDKSRITAALSSEIIVCGGLIYLGAITEAVALGLNGIITGGINARDYKGMAGGHLEPSKKFGTDIGISMLVCEGFGSVPIGEDIFNLLKIHSRQFAILDGNRAKLILPSGDKDSLHKIRTTKLPAHSLELTAEPLAEVDALDLAIGQKARVIGPPFFGAQGQIIAIDKTVSVLPSGVQTYLVSLQTQTRKIKVPFTNIEVIG